jgi:predicted Fe-S protein YdhL (DUF1289 family)
MTGPRHVSGGVKSPCISVCEMDAQGRFCLGCWRTLDEIAGWISFPDDEKRAVLARLRERRASARPLPAEGLERP